MTTVLETNTTRSIAPLVSAMQDIPAARRPATRARPPDAGR
jgi:hypothetical protein